MIIQNPSFTFFPETDSVFDCLFPFYKTVFAEHYNWEGNLKLTYPLLETVAWQEVAKMTGFNTINRVALGLLDVKKPFLTELNEACEQFKVEIPAYSNDRIQEKIVIPVIDYLKRLNHKSIELKPFEKFPFHSSGKIRIANQNTFGIFYQLFNAAYLFTKNQISILLPDYDSQYVLISGEKLSV